MNTLTQDMPSVSIIIPCYNCQNYIDETLECLVKQTYQKFEVICINDGSTDETLVKLQQWLNRNVLNLRVINQENGGVSCARNRGIQEACGKYLLFLDADDVYHHAFVELMYRAIENENADTVYCRLSRDLQSVLTHNPIKMAVPRTQNEAMRNLLYQMGEYGFYCYIYRKDILVEYNIEFRVGQRYFEDREFNWKYLCHCGKVLWIDEALYGYRIASGSAMRKKITRERIESVEHIVLDLEAYMHHINCPFYSEFKGALYSRVAWSWAKSTAISKDKDMFHHLLQTYDMKACMRRTAKDGDILVVLSSILFLIHPMLFFKLVSLMG